MNLSLPVASLYKSFQAVSRFVPARTTKDVLSMVLLQVQDGRAVLKATDLDCGIVCDLGEVSEQGHYEFLLHPEMVGQILRHCRADEINISLHQRDLKLSYIDDQAAEFHFYHRHPGDFPAVKSVGLDDEEWEFHLLTAGQAAVMIEQVVFAADPRSRNETFALDGVEVGGAPGGLTLAATDRDRLAVAIAQTVDVGEPPLGWQPEVLPIESAKKIAGALGSLPEDTQVSLGVHQNQVIVEGGGLLIVSRVVAGRFPNWGPKLHESREHEIEFVAGNLMAALNQVMISARKKADLVEIRVDSVQGNAGEIALKSVTESEKKPGKKSLFSSESQVEGSVVKLPFVLSDSHKLERLELLRVHVSPRHLQQFLKTVPAEEKVMVNLTNSDESLIFQAGPHFRNHWYVMQPVPVDQLAEVTR